MIEVITDDKHRVAKWATPILKSPDWSGFTAFGFELDGELIGAVIFNQFTNMEENNDMHVSVASTNSVWWNRDYLSEMYDYVWNQCKCVRLTAVVASSNKKSHKLVKALGFKQEGVLRKRFFPEDGVVYGQLKNECKWLER